MSDSEQEMLVLKSIYNEDFLPIDDQSFDIRLRLDCLTKKIRLIDENSGESTDLSHLPPLIFHVDYPSNYPEENSPKFSIRCDFLSFDQLKSLADQLEQLWTPGDVVIFQWIEFLREFFNEKLILSASNSSTNDENANDRRFSTEFHRIGFQQIYRELIDFNRREEQNQFEIHWQNCSICCEVKLGRDCLSFELCRHFACLSCLNEFARRNFHRQLNCFQCDRPLFLSELRRIFNDDRLFVEYQERQFELSNDIVWCPRCHRSIICPPSESQSGNNPSFVQCFQCQFAFCRRCDECWHPQIRCPKDEKRQTILEDPNSTSTSSKRQISSNDIRKILMEIDTAQMIEQCSKPCPSCQVRIEKNGGCQHMHCRACQMHFCWNCGWFGTSYSFHPCRTEKLNEIHQKSTVALSKEIHDQVEQMLTTNEMTPKNLPKEITRRVQRCPEKNCGRLQIKTTRSNLNFCEHCQISFCFVCGERVYGDFHFSPYACQRQSDVPRSQH